MILPLRSELDGLISIKGESHDGWHPEQAASREQALKMFTMSPAYAAFEEKDKGSIEPGKLADLTVLSADIMKSTRRSVIQARLGMSAPNQSLFCGSCSKR